MIHYERGILIDTVKMIWENVGGKDKRAKVKTDNGHQTKVSVFLCTHLKGLNFVKLTILSIVNKEKKKTNLDVISLYVVRVHCNKETNVVLRREVT